MKKTGLLLTLTVAMLFAGCGKNTPAAEPADNVSEQVTESTIKPTEEPNDTEEPVAEPKDTEEPEETTDTGENVDMVDMTSTGEEEDEILPFNKLSVARWDELSHDFYIDVKLFYASNIYEYRPSCDYDIQEGESLKTICRKNKKYLTGKGKYTDDKGKTHDAAYFFCNNNAYAVYTSKYSVGEDNKKKTTMVHLRNRMIWDETDYYTSSNKLVKIPFPVSINIDDFSVRECWEKGENWDEKLLFSLCDYKEAKEFYSMFDEGTAVADDSKKIIKVRGTVSMDNTGFNKQVWAVLDFGKKTYEVQNEDGTIFHSRETMYDMLEEEYKSAGTIDGKEVIYDIGNNIFVKENGKRHMIMNKEEMDDFLGKIDGYNCVGNECVLTLTKIKGNKYYFDVKASFDDNEEWTYNDTLVIKD